MPSQVKDSYNSFEDNSDHSFNVYVLQMESNRLEIIATAILKKKMKKCGKLINFIKMLNWKGDKNPYNIVQRNFNYPQFYQLKNGKNGISIVPFKFTPNE